MLLGWVSLFEELQDSSMQGSYSHSQGLDWNYETMILCSYLCIEGNEVHKVQRNLHACIWPTCCMTAAKFFLSHLLLLRLPREPFSSLAHRHSLGPSSSTLRSLLWIRTLDQSRCMNLVSATVMGLRQVVLSSAPHAFLMPPPSPRTCVNSPNYFLS